MANPYPPAEAFASTDCMRVTAAAIPSAIHTTQTQYLPHPITPFPVPFLLVFLSLHPPPSPPPLPVSHPQETPGAEVTLEQKLLADADAFAALVQVRRQQANCSACPATAVARAPFTQEQPLCCCCCCCLWWCHACVNAMPGHLKSCMISVNTCCYGCCLCHPAFDPHPDLLHTRTCPTAPWIDSIFNQPWCALLGGCRRMRTPCAPRSPTTGSSRSSG